MTLDILDIQKKYGTKIALKAFDCGAIKLSPENPFTWASGYKMPIYNDNRSLLAFPDIRKYICSAFMELLEVLNFKPQWVAGVATGGIPHGTTLADKLNLPFAYIRSSSKDHGLQNQVEGLGSSASFNGKKVLVVEDLISTAGSSVKAIEAARFANADTPYCFAIFSYGFRTAEESFAKLNPRCEAFSILNYNLMLELANEKKLITNDQKLILEKWSEDPFVWWEKQSKL